MSSARASAASIVNTSCPGCAAPSARAAEATAEVINNNTKAVLAKRNIEILSSERYQLTFW